MPNFTVIANDERGVVIRDDGPWSAFPTVTNGAEDVVADLVQRGILKTDMRLWYWDSQGEFGEIVLKDLAFAGFAFAQEPA
jgi:hypothetical protein